MKIKNNSSVIIISSNATVTIPVNDGIGTYVNVVCHDGSSYHIGKQCYKTLEAVFLEEHSTVVCDAPEILD